MSEPGYWAEVEAAWEGRPQRAAPKRVGALRGGALAAVMLGMQEALEPQKRDEVVVEVDVDQPDGTHQKVRVRFDPGSPRRTVAVVRG